MSAETDAFGRWIIVFDRGRNLIGRVDPSASKGKPFLVLIPCYELIDAKQVVQTGAGMQIVNLVEVTPIGMCLYDVAVQVSDDKLTCIDLQFLSEHDRRTLFGKIDALRKQLVEKRSDIKIVNSIVTSDSKH